jgi:hypothetical protein
VWAMCWLILSLVGEQRRPSSPSQRSVPGSTARLRLEGVTAGHVVLELRSLLCCYGTRD